jgi:hypothetical protein
LNNKLVWSVLKTEDFEKTGTSENDLDEVIDELIINIPQAKIIVLIYETKEQERTITKAMIYSVKNIDSLALVKRWEPNGTKYLASIKLPNNIQESEKEIITTIEEEMKKVLD